MDKNNIENFKKATNKSLGAVHTHTGEIYQIKGKVELCKCNLDIVKNKSKIEPKNYLKNVGGITLIALVITIIVLLILVGVCIATLSGNNGILNQANNAKKENTLSREKEQLGVAYNSAVADKLDENQVTVDELQSELDKIVGSGKTVVSGGKILKVNFTETNNTYKISKNKKIEEYKKEASTPVYAFLCDEDGDKNGETLVLSDTDTINGYTIIKSYGDSEAYESNEDNAENYYGNIYYYPIWKEDKDIIKKVIILNKIVPTITERWFNCSNLTEIENIENLDTSNVTNMTCMFLNCSNITNIDLSNFDTSSVRYMTSMFLGCKSLTDLDLSNLDTNNVEKMNYMFQDCSNIRKINLSNLGNDKLQDVGYMFYDCENLEELNFTNFKTDNVKNMMGMFTNCKKLQNLNLESFNTSNVEDMRDIFFCCYALNELDLSNFNTSNVKWGDRIFYYCKNLKVVNIDNFDLSDVNYVDSMFEECTQLKTIYINSDLNLNNECIGRNMFKGCINLVGGAGTKFDASKIDIKYAHVDGGTNNPGYFTKK